MKRGRAQNRILALILVAVVAGTTLAASLPNWAGASSKRSLVTYPRNETLITSGNQWAPIQGFNPYTGRNASYYLPGDYAVGTVGLCNETLLRYDPLKDKYIDWLAESAIFTSAKVFTVEVRPGIRWSNGQKFTGQDVAFNFRLGRFSSAFWHDLYLSLKSITVKGLTVTFTFKKTPSYDQWQNLIWNLPMLNPGQAGSITSSASLLSYNPADPIGTGPYVLDLAGYDPQLEVVWKKKAVWWAAKQKLVPSPKPEYVQDLVAGNSFDLWSPLLQEVEDLDNNYFPGIQSYVAKGQAQTYYPEAPYHLSANTSWLVPNTKHKPLDDPQFRRALAEAVNVYKIAGSGDYGGLVTIAGQTGLLKVWKKWIDQKEVSEYGYSRADVGAAKATLAAAGYKDVNGDGYVENMDGSPINLKIAVPMGWSDWEAAESIIVSSAKAAGIQITIDKGDYDYYVLQRNSGTFDLVIDNTAQLSDNPWTYFDYLFHEPIFGTQTSTNFSRYKNTAAWKLVVKLDRTPLDNIAARKQIMSTLEYYELTDVPDIPLWYNGVWSQSQSKYWTNWPSSSSNRNYTPTMWRGYMQMTGIDMITHLEPAATP